MLATDELTDAQWQIADAIARQLVLEGTDVNELRKAISYLRDRQDEANGGKRFFDYLKTLVRHGNAIGHSKRTLGYYQSLDQACNQHLEPYQGDVPRLLHILSWAARLVRYYDKGVPTGEIAQPTVLSEREAEVRAVSQTHQFQVGQALEATVTAIKGNKVTYEILGSIKLTQKEPKLASNFSGGQTITVIVDSLRDDGTLKRVKVNPVTDL